MDLVAQPVEDLEECQMAAECIDLSFNATTTSCPSHFGKTMKWWCEQDRVFVCDECLLTCHINHKMRTVADFGTDLNKVAKDTLAAVQSSIDEMDLVLKTTHPKLFTEYENCVAYTKLDTTLQEVVETCTKQIRGSHKQARKECAEGLNTEIDKETKIIQHCQRLKHIASKLVQHELCPVVVHKLLGVLNGIQKVVPQVPRTRTSRSMKPQLGDGGFASMKKIGVQVSVSEFDITLPKQHCSTINASGYGKTMNLPKDVLSVINFGLPNVNSVYCGFSHAMAITKKGECYAIGENNHGQLGIGDTGNRNTWTLVQIAGAIKTVACGNAFTLFLTEAGQVFSCGYNKNGELVSNCTL